MTSAQNWPIAISSSHSPFKAVFNVKCKLWCYYDKTVREVPSEEKIAIHTKRKHYWDTCREPYMHSLQLGFLFLHWIKAIWSRIGWATAHYKIIRWLLSIAQGGQSVITHFCVDKLRKLPISIAGELGSVIALIFDEICEKFTFS